MTIQTYSPSEVSLHLAILYEVTDFAPDSLVSITKDRNFYETSKGAVGGVERTQLADETYTLEINLSQTSPSNSVLNALALLDKASGRGVFPIFCKDSSGNSLFLASSCWVESPAVASYTGNIETRTWTIKCAEMVFGLAGNETDRNIIEQVGQLSSLIGSFGASKGLF